MQIKKLLLLFCCVCLSLVSSLPGADSAAVKAQFAQPPREYASAPLWVWNDMLTEEQVISTLRDLAGQGVKQAFVHPRPGLMTPYLGEDWFRLWKAALQEAERLDMNIWIYDENSYPSGFAGGFVPEAMPESRGKGLVLREVKQPPKWSDEVLAVFRVKDDGSENVTQEIKAGKKLASGSYLTATIQLAPERAWHGGKFYVDLLHPGVTQKFLDITMGAYQREIGDQFGKRVPGVFTDEPHLAPAGGLHWSDRLPEAFQKRWGYDLVENLPSLAKPVGDWKRVRHDYYRLLLEEFIDCWAKPFYEYCEKHNLEFTGHYWEHGWPGAGHGGDNMAMYAWHQRPAIDILMNEYQEGPNAQFGNVRAVLELSSVANQLGRQRTLCEAYGAGGWDLRFEDMKRIGDWIYVLGVNTMDEHLSYITIRGARKRDHPQSFSYHEPWWDQYHVMAHYFTRLSLALSQGEQVNRILVIEPTTTAWLYQGDPELKELGDRFQALVTDLAKQQVEFDIGCEDIMGRHGSVDGTALVVGRRRYDAVVLPPMTENLDRSTMDLLTAYAKAGGVVYACGSAPTLVGGRPSETGAALFKTGVQGGLDPAALAPLLLQRKTDGFAITRKASDQGILFHHRRKLDDGEILFLVNTSIEQPSVGTIRAAAKGVQRWNLQNGRIGPYPFQAIAEGLEARFNLAPCGSLLLFLSSEQVEPAVRSAATVETIQPAGKPDVRRLEPNVLTLDFVEVTVGGQTQKNVYFFKAAEAVFKAHGLEANPWERAVQFRDELIKKTFPAESGFEATYRFRIEGEVPKRLEAVVERSDLYTVTLNGQPVKAEPGAWWLDKAFGRIDIAAAAKVGENALSIKAQPMTMFHELEPAYLLGDFALKATDSGFMLAAERPLGLGSWKEQGLPLYGHGVAYTETFDIEKPSGRYVVSLPQWYGSVARVSVNGKPAGTVAWQPWQCDVTRQLQPDRNTIEVVVVGTLKNTLGPHHAGHMVGRAWPVAFAQGPESGPPAGEKYDTLDYGLFEPFVLKKR